MYVQKQKKNFLLYSQLGNRYNDLSKRVSPQQ